MTRIERLLRSLWPLRWLRSALELLHGARVHPACELIGSSGIRLARRVAVGARSRLVLIGSGKIILESGAWLSSDVDVETDACISIGSGTTVQRRCSLNGSVRIGRGCLLAPNVFISSRTHPFRSFPHLHIREQERRLRACLAGAGEPDHPVWIQDDCWLGVNAVISPGVTVGKGSIVGASAVVTRDVAPYSVVAGVPARRLGSRLSWTPPLRIDPSRDEDLVYILAGCIPDRCDGKSRHIAVTAEEPLLAAFSPVARAIAVHYRANREVELEVGGKRMTVGEGESSFVVPTVGLHACFDALMFELALATTATGALLELSRLESADTIAGPV